MEGQATYEKIVAEQLANYAPDAFRVAQADAKRELEALRKRIPTLQLVFIGADPESVAVSVDGAPVPGSKLQERLPQDPGEHTVTATREGSPPLTRTVRLEEGQTASVDLSFTEASSAVPAPTAPQPDEPGGPSLVPALIAFGVGGVGLAVGAITGAMSLSRSPT